MKTRKIGKGKRKIKNKGQKEGRSGSKREYRKCEEGMMVRKKKGWTGNKEQENGRKVWRKKTEQQEG